MKSTILKFLAFIFLFYAAPLLSQNFSTQFRHYSIDDGLSEANAICIIQDRYGFLWIGTQDGLNRYDGYEFTVFKYNGNDSNSISGNFIAVLLEDKKGIIWIGTDKGLCSFNSSTAKFTRYDFEVKRKKKRRGRKITALFEDKDSSLWVGLPHGKILKLNNRTAKPDSFQKRIIKIYNFSRKTISSILEDRNGNLWFGTLGDGFFELDKSSGSIKHFMKDDDKKNNLPNVVNSMREDENGYLLIGTPAGLSVFNPTQERFEKFYPPDAQTNLRFDLSKLDGIDVKTLYIDKDGYLWFGTLLRGLFFVDIKENRLINFKKDELNPLSINNNNIFSIYESNSKILWIGTGKGGLNKLDKSKKHFFNITKISDGISNNSIGAVLEDANKNLWIGTDWGLNRIDAKTGKVKTFLHENENGNSIGSNKILSLGEDKKGNIWIGTNSGLHKYSPASDKITGYKHNSSDPKSLPYNSIRDIFCDGNIIWLGSSGGGLIMFKPEEEEFVQFTYNPEDKNSLSENLVAYIFKDNKGLLWICMQNSVNTFDPKKNRFEKALSIAENYSPIIFHTGFQESDSVYWFGTDNGLIKFNAVSKKYIIYNEQNGLANNNVYAVIPDSKNNLWLSTNHGITKYITEKSKFINYTSKDGLVCNEFNSRAFFKNKSGMIFFGSIDGLTYFNPDNSKPLSKTPLVIISKFSVFDKELVKNKFYTDGEEIFLDHSQNFISIEFSALDFSEQSFNEFAYRLENVDKDWVYAGQRRYVSYTQLDPGDYKFTVKSSDKLRLWKGKGTALAIHISPPFWQTWQFKIIPPAIIAAIVALFIFIKIRNIIEIERLRVKIASDLHDDVGASLSKISMIAGLLEYESDKLNMTKSVKKLVNISREIISTMSDIVWSIDARNDTISDLIDRMKNFALTQSAEKNIEVNIKTKCSSPNKKIRINVKQNIYLIFKEAVNNAVKYSGSKEFDLKIEFSNKHFEFIFRDNGSGLPENANRKGNGLRNMKMRAAKIKGNLKLIRENGLTISLKAKCK